jgi:hypothetical protein
MKAVAIKFADGTYYAGAYKAHAKTLLGAMLYKSEKTAKSVIEKSVNFHSYPNNPYKIVSVELNEQE